MIHTDFEKGFIRAEVIGYDDFIDNNGEQGSKDAGKWRLRAKTISLRMATLSTSFQCIKKSQVLDFKDVKRKCATSKIYRNWVNFSYWL